MRRLAFALCCLLPAAVTPAADDKALPDPHVHLKFDGDDKNEGKGEATVSLKNTEFKDKALVINGIYPLGKKEDAEKASDVRIGTPKLSYDAFTVAARFKIDPATPKGYPILVGGHKGRWFVLGQGISGNLYVGLNNHKDEFVAKKTPLPSNKWVVVACSVSVKDLKVVVFVDGKKADEFALPKDFKFAVADSQFAESDKLWLTANYATGRAFKGSIDEFIVYDTALTPEQLAKVPLKP